MSSTEKLASEKTCTCDDKFILFMKSKQFKTILKDAMENVMGDIIRNILKHQIKEDLSLIISKIEDIQLDLKYNKGDYPNLNKSLEIDDEINNDNDSDGGIRNEEKINDEHRAHGVVKWFSIDKGYGFITVSDTMEDVFVYKNAIIRSNNAELSLQAGEPVEFVIKIGKKGPEALQVTGMNGGPLMNSLDNSTLKTSIAQTLSQNNSQERHGSWHSHHNISRHSSAEINFRSGTRRLRRHTLSASESMRGSRQSISSRPSSSEGRGGNRGGPNFYGRALSSDGRTRNRGSRYQGKNNFRGTISNDGSLWGSRHEIFRQDNPIELPPTYDDRCYP